MHNDLNGNSVSDQLERELLRQTPRNRQIPYRQNCGLQSAKTVALAKLELVQLHLRNIFLGSTTTAG